MPLSAETVRAAYERIRDEVGPGVTVVAATKYVSADELAALAEAGVAVVGENRLQDLGVKRARYGDAFRWHFIGHLQSRKARDVSELCELCHSLSSVSAARRLTIPALVEVNLSGEESKSGVAPEALRAFLAEVAGVGVEVRGLMTMPPLASDPEALAPVLPAPARAGRRARARGALDGHLAGLPRRIRGRGHAGARRLRSVRAVVSAGVMGLGDVWSRALVYFGIVEEDEYWDEEAYAAEEELERTYDRDRQNVRRLSPRASRQRDEFEDWSDPGSAAQTATMRPPSGPAARGRRGGPPRSRCTSSSRRASTTPSRSPTSSRTRRP